MIKQIFLVLAPLLFMLVALDMPLIYERKYIMSRVECYKGNEQLKIANTKELVSVDDFRHYTSEIIKCKNNIDYFANTYYTIVSPGKGKHVIKLYDKQSQLIHKFIDHDRVITLLTEGKLENAYQTIQ